MQLIRIVHSRCGEYDSYTLVLVPDSWTEDAIHEAITNAYNEVFAAANAYDEARKSLPQELKNYGVNSYFPLSPNYKAFPDKTVAEVDAEHERLKLVWEEFKKTQAPMKRGFEYYMKQQGASTIHSEMVPTFDVDWGHHHGKRLGYKDEPIPDRTVGNLLTGKVDDDEFEE